MPFAFNAKHIFLTYAQCPIAKEDLLAHLRTLFPSASIRVGHELHAAEGHHLHAFVQNTTAFRTKNERYFDYNGFHPNIQSARRPKECYEYCGKDNDIVEHGEFTFTQDKRSWSDLLATNTKEEFWAVARESFPRDIILNHEKLEYYANKAFKVEAAPYVPRSLADFNTTRFPDLRLFTEQMQDPDRPKSLILIGESRTGKTEWARSLGMHMYFNGSFMLDLWDNTADYAIFDDWEDWSRFFNYKQFLGAQHNFVVADKYRKKQNVTWGKPCIVLSNDRPSFRDWTWIDANCFFVNVSNNKLF